jgi:hypothetical protein
MVRSFFERLAVLFEYTRPTTAEDLLEVARTARENKAKMPDGTVFITKSDPLSKRSINEFLLFYGTKAGTKTPSHASSR